MILNQQIRLINKIQPSLEWSVGFVYLMQTGVIHGDTMKHAEREAYEALEKARRSVNLEKSKWSLWWIMESAKNKILHTLWFWEQAKAEKNVLLEKKQALLTDATNDARALLKHIVFWEERFELFVEALQQWSDTVIPVSEINEWIAKLKKEKSYLEQKNSSYSANRELGALTLNRLDEVDRALHDLIADMPKRENKAQARELLVEAVWWENALLKYQHILEGWGDDPVLLLSISAEALDEATRKLWDTIAKLKAWEDSLSGKAKLKAFFIPNRSQQESVTRFLEIDQQNILEISRLITANKAKQALIWLVKWAITEQRYDTYISASQSASFQLDETQLRDDITRLEGLQENLHEEMRKAFLEKKDDQIELILTEADKWITNLLILLRELLDITTFNNQPETKNSVEHVQTKMSKRTRILLSLGIILWSLLLSWCTTIQQWWSLDPVPWWWEDDKWWQGWWEDWQPSSPVSWLIWTEWTWNWWGQNDTKSSQQEAWTWLSGNEWWWWWWWQKLSDAGWNDWTEWWENDQGPVLTAQVTWVEIESVQAYEWHSDDWVIKLRTEAWKWASVNEVLESWTMFKVLDTINWADLKESSHNSYAKVVVLNPVTWVDWQTTHYEEWKEWWVWWPSVLSSAWHLNSPTTVEVHHNVDTINVQTFDQVQAPATGQDYSKGQAKWQQDHTDLWTKWTEVWDSGWANEQWQGFSFIKSEPIFPWTEEKNYTPAIKSWDALFEKLLLDKKIPEPESEQLPSPDGWKQLSLSNEWEPVPPAVSSVEFKQEIWTDTSGDLSKLALAAWWWLLAWWFWLRWLGRKIVKYREETGLNKEFKKIIKPENFRKFINKDLLTAMQANKKAILEIVDEMRIDEKTWEIYYISFKWEWEWRIENAIKFIQIMQIKDIESLWNFIRVARIKTPEDFWVFMKSYWIKDPKIIWKLIIISWITELKDLCVLAVQLIWVNDLQALWKFYWVTWIGYNHYNMRSVTEAFQITSPEALWEFVLAAEMLENSMAGRFIMIESLVSMLDFIKGPQNFARFLQATWIKNPEELWYLSRLKHVWISSLDSLIEFLTIIGITGAGNFWFFIRGIQMNLDEIPYYMLWYQWRIDWIHNNRTSREVLDSLSHHINRSVNANKLAEDPLEIFKLLSNFWITNPEALWEFAKFAFSWPWKYWSLAKVASIRDPNSLLWFINATWTTTITHIWDILKDAWATLDNLIEIIKAYQIKRPDYIWLLAYNAWIRDLTDLVMLAESMWFNDAVQLWQFAQCAWVRNYDPDQLIDFINLFNSRTWNEVSPSSFATSYRNTILNYRRNGSPSSSNEPFKLDDVQLAA